MRPTPALVFSLVFLASVGTISQYGTVLAQNQPSTTSETVKVLAMGHAGMTPTLTRWLSAEPSTDPTIIPTRVGGSVSGSDIFRYMRIYFPRNQDELKKYGFIFLACVDMSYISVRQAKMIHDALTESPAESPMGAVNTRSIISAVSTYYLPWRDSILSETFPNDVDAVIADEQNFQGKTGPLVIRDDPSLPSIIKPFKSIEALYPNYYGVNTVPKPGSVILSYTKNSLGVGHPIPGQIAHVFYWNWENSTTFTFRDMVTDAFWSAPAGNPYALDIIVNIIWFSTDQDLPLDPLMVHDYRQLVYYYAIQKSLLTSLLDFAEIFGADTTNVYAKASQTEEYKSRAAKEYLERDFAAAHDTMKIAMTGLVNLDRDASKLKNEALFWVYMVQWTVTTSALLITAFVLWSLMIRRTLYHQVSSTRWQT